MAAHRQCFSLSVSVGIALNLHASLPKENLAYVKDAGLSLHNGRIYVGPCSDVGTLRSKTMTVIRFRRHLLGANLICVVPKTGKNYLPSAMAFHYSKVIVKRRCCFRFSLGLVDYASCRLVVGTSFGVKSADVAKTSRRRVHVDDCAVLTVPASLTEGIFVQMRSRLSGTNGLKSQDWRFALGESQDGLLDGSKIDKSVNARTPSTVVQS